MYIRCKQQKINTYQNTKQLGPLKKYRPRTITNIKLLGGGGGLNSFYRRLTLTSVSAVVYKIQLVVLESCLSGDSR